MAEENRELIRKAVRGDEAAIELLLERHAPSVECALRIDRQWQAVLDPADVMQVTFLEAFLRIGEFDPDGTGSFGGWLHRIAQNNVKDAIRLLKSQKRPQPRRRVIPRSGSDCAAAFCELLGVTSTTPSRDLRQRDAARMLEDAVAMLPTSYAQAVKLYDLQGLPIQDVAAQMKRSPGAVHMLRARAMEILRDMLGSGTDFFGSSS